MSAVGGIALGMGMIPAGAAPVDDIASGYQYDPRVRTIYAPTPEELTQVNKGNYVLYPKSAQLESGRLVAAFERSIGDPVGQTIPLYSSDDLGTTWQKLTDVPAPAYLSDDPELAAYTSNWTNPYLYVVPETVGDLEQGTLLMATLVSGDDGYYRDRKAEDPSWVPTSDGDRQDLAIALFSSTDEGGTWDVVNIIGTGGWSADYGNKFSSGNVHHQQDPVWEPYLMVYDGQLVAYYTDENDWIGFDRDTGILTEHPENHTGVQPESGLNPNDTGGQILLHRTWDGTSTTGWSEPVVDVYGAFTEGVGFTGRPGMTNVVPTTDGKWILTAEFGIWKVSDDPLRFWDVPSQSPPFHANGGSPVIITMPNPTDPTQWSLVFNSGSTGNDVYVNASGRSDGQWLRHQTPIGNGFSRNLQYVPQTGRVVILRGTWGGSPITHTEVDLGNSEGAYYSLVNRATGQAIGTGGRTQDANLTGDTPDVVLEDLDETADTQRWHVVAKGEHVTLLNKGGGRALGIWQGSSASGARLAQWTDDDGSDKRWIVEPTADGYVKLRSSSNASNLITGTAQGGPVTASAEIAASEDPTADHIQQWELVIEAPSPADLTEARQRAGMIQDDPLRQGDEVELDLSTGHWVRAGVSGHVFVIDEDGEVVGLGVVDFDADARVSIELPENLRMSGRVSFAVVFDDGPLAWDVVEVVAPLSVEAAISGLARVGGLLTAVVNVTEEVEAEVSYQWLRDDQEIPGASASEYTISADDVGARLSVRVIAQAPGHETATAVSAPTDVIPDPDGEGPTEEPTTEEPTTEEPTTEEPTGGGPTSPGQPSPGATTPGDDGLPPTGAAVRSTVVVALLLLMAGAGALIGRRRHIALS